MLDRMLSFDPKDRPTATQVLGDPAMREPNANSTDGAAAGGSAPELGGGEGGDADSECLSHVYYWADNAVVPRQYVAAVIVFPLHDRAHSWPRSRRHSGVLEV